MTDHVQDPSRFIDETEIEEVAGPGRTCDSIVLYPESWLALEIVFRQMSRATQVDGNYEDLLRALGFAAVEKLMQVDATIDRTIDGGLGGLPPPNSVFPVVVVGSSFLSSPLVHEELNSQIEACEPRRIGKDHRVRPFVVLDLYELRSVLAIAQRDGVMVPDLLDEWQGSRMASAGFRNWIMTSGPPPPNWGEDEWLKPAGDRLFRGAESFQPCKGCQSTVRTPCPQINISVALPLTI